MLRQVPWKPNRLHKLDALWSSDRAHLKYCLKQSNYKRLYPVFWLNRRRLENVNWLKSMSKCLLCWRAEEAVASHQYPRSDHTFCMKVRHVWEKYRSEKQKWRPPRFFCTVSLISPVFIYQLLWVGCPIPDSYIRFLLRSPRSSF